MRLISEQKDQYLDKAVAAGPPVTAAQLNAKLTATKAATQANSTATDVAGLVADFNALLAKLKASGQMT